MSHNSLTPGHPWNKCGSECAKQKIEMISRQGAKPQRRNVATKRDREINLLCSNNQIAFCVFPFAPSRLCVSSLRLRLPMSSVQTGDLGKVPEFDERSQF